MIVRIYISCDCKCKFDSQKCNSDQMWNKDKCPCKCKNPMKHCVCKKYYIWNLSTCA